MSDSITPAEQVVKIRVTNINDIYPKFTEETYNISVKERDDCDLDLIRVSFVYRVVVNHKNVYVMVEAYLLFLNPLVNYIQT